MGIKKSTEAAFTATECLVLKCTDVTKEGSEYARVLFNVRVNGVTIYGMTYQEYVNKKGEEGYMIEFPSRKGKNSKGDDEYFNVCFFPISSDLKKLMRDQIESMLGGQA